MSTFVTRLYATFEQAETAVIALERAGVSRDDISIVSHHADSRADTSNAPASVREPSDLTASDAASRDAAAGAGVLGLAGAGGGALVGLGLLAIPGLGPVVAAGWLATAALGAAVGGVVGAGAGGLIGALTNAGVSREEAEIYAEAVRRGGTLVSVQVANDAALPVIEVLDAIPSVNVAQRRAAWERAGWREFDVDAAPLTDAQVAAEREAWMLDR